MRDIHDDDGRDRPLKRKRPIEEADQGPPSKQRQMNVQDWMPLINGLPFEMRLKVKEQVLGQTHVRDAIADARIARQASGFLGGSAASDNQFKSIPDIIASRRLFLGGQKLTSFPRDFRIANTGQSEAAVMAFHCQVAPLKGGHEVSVLVNDVCKLPSILEKYQALHALAYNMEHLASGHKAELLRTVCDEDYDAEYFNARQEILHLLVERAGHLYPGQQKKLIDATFSELGEPEFRERFLHAFSKNNHLFHKSAQKIIVKNLLHDKGERYEYRLGVLAERMANMPLSEKDDVAREILTLDRAKPDRIWAMSKLAERIDTLSPPMLVEVAHAATSEIENKGQHDLHGSHAWQTSSSLCRVEMAHHLSKHKAILPSEVNSAVSNFIKDALESKGNYRAKAQLLPHMSAQQRADFMETHLPWTDVLHVDTTQVKHEGIIEGMSLRIRDLNTDEQDKLTGFLTASHNSGATSLSKLKDYCVDKLEHFNAENTNHLTNRFLIEMNYDNLEEFVNRPEDWEDRVEGWDRSGTIEPLRRIAMLSHRLEPGVYQRVIATAHNQTAAILKETGGDAEERDNSSLACIGALTAVAAQCIANKSRAELVKNVPALAKRFSQHEVNHDAAAARGLDARAPGRGR